MMQNGFSTRKQDEAYNKALYGIIFLLQYTIAAFMGHQEKLVSECFDEQKFNRHFRGMLSKLISIEKGKNLPPKYAFAFQDLKSKIFDSGSNTNSSLALNCNQYHKEKGEMDISLDSSLTFNQRYNSTKIELNQLKKQTPAVAVSQQALFQEGFNCSSKQVEKRRESLNQKSGKDIYIATKDNNINHSIEQVRSFTSQTRNMDVIVESDLIEDSKHERYSQKDPFKKRESYSGIQRRNNHMITRNSNKLRSHVNNLYLSSDIMPASSKHNIEDNYEQYGPSYLTNSKEEYYSNQNQPIQNRSKISMKLSGKVPINARSTYNILNQQETNKCIGTGCYLNKNKNQLNITHEMKSPPLHYPDSRKSQDVPLSTFEDNLKSKKIAKSGYMKLRNKSIPQSAIVESKGVYNQNSKNLKQKLQKIKSKSYYPSLILNTCGYNTIF